MTDLENKKEVTESSTQLSSPMMTNVESETDNVKTTPTTTETANASEEKEENSTDLANNEEDDFTDAVDEMNIKTAHDLSQVISELQGTVIANIPTGKEEIVVKPDEEVKVLEPNDITLDTIPEDELGSSLINKEAPTEADIDIPLNDASITAPSEPNSPRPRATDLQIATHFEQIRHSIDLPAGQNMADFVTPPTPGVAPPSMLGGEGDDDNDDDLREANKVNEDKDEASAATATATAKAGEVKPSTTNAITLSNIDFDTVKPNFLTPRAQEKFGKIVYSKNQRV